MSRIAGKRLATGHPTRSTSVLFTMLQKTLKGNIFGGGSSHVETPKPAGLYKSGLLKIDEMIDGKNIRGVIKFSESDW